MRYSLIALFVLSCSPSSQPTPSNHPVDEHRQLYVDTDYFVINSDDRYPGGLDWRVTLGPDSEGSILFGAWDFNTKTYKPAFDVSVTLTKLSGAASADQIHGYIKSQFEPYKYHVGDREFCPLIVDGTQFEAYDDIMYNRIVFVDVKDVRVTIWIRSPISESHRASGFLKMFHPKG